MSTDNPFEPPASRVDGPPSDPEVGRGERITPGVVRQLERTRPWVLFLAVLALLGVGLMVLFAAFFVAGVGAGETGAAGRWMGLSYLVLAMLYVYPTICLLRYGIAIRDLRGEKPTAAALEKALGYQASFWRTVGILSLALIAIYFALIAVIVAVGVGEGAGA